MKLEKYLADYLETGIERLHEKGLPMDFTTEGLEPIIKQGLDAFESTEQTEIKIVSLPDDKCTGECPKCGADFQSDGDLRDIIYPAQSMVVYCYNCECGAKIQEVFSRDFFEEMNK